MIIFKTYEGFFDFLKKKEHLNRALYNRVNSFLKNEDKESIESIFINENITFKHIEFYIVGANPCRNFSIFRYGSNSDLDILRILEETNQIDIRFMINVDMDIMSNESDKYVSKIKDVANIIQSVFDFGEVRTSGSRSRLKIVDKDNVEVPHRSSIRFNLEFNF